LKNSIIDITNGKLVLCRSMMEERFGFKKIYTLDQKTPLIATLKLCGKTNEDRLVGTEYETSGKYGTFRFLLKYEKN